MASYNLKIEHFLFPKSLSLFYLLMITGLFSLPSPFTSAAISFNITSFNFSDHRITYERAFPENQSIQLTNNRVTTGSIGRATYVHPMRLWDKASRNLTDFTTHFSFIINSRNNINYGDGLAFFLAPINGSTIPDNNGGGAMGLARGDQILNSTNNPFVAVEFDIFPNIPWDPPISLGWPDAHLVIDINSMESVANVSWEVLEYYDICHFC